MHNIQIEKKEYKDQYAKWFGIQWSDSMDKKPLIYIDIPNL